MALGRAVQHKDIISAKRHQVKGLDSANHNDYCEHVSGNTVNWGRYCCGDMVYGGAGTPAIAAAARTLVTGGNASFLYRGSLATLDTANHRITVTPDATRAMLFEGWAWVSHNGGAVDQITLSLHKNGSTVSVLASSDHHILNGEQQLLRFIHIEPSVASADTFQLGILSAGGNTVSFYRFGLFFTSLYSRA